MRSWRKAVPIVLSLLPTTPSLVWALVVLGLCSVVMVVVMEIMVVVMVMFFRARFSLNPTRSLACTPRLLPSTSLSPEYLWERRHHNLWKIWGLFVIVIEEWGVIITTIKRMFIHYCNRRMGVLVLWSEVLYSKKMVIPYYSLSPKYLSDAI